MSEHPLSDDEVPLDPALARLIAELPREVPPPEAQWTAIRPRLAERGAVRRVPRLALAAAAVVILAVAFWIRQPAVPDVAGGATPPVPSMATGPDGRPASTDSGRVPDGATPVPAVTTERDAWDPRAFEAALAARTDLDAATIAALRRNMAVIDSAVADSRRALRAAPTDPELGALVQFGESQRRALLAQLARLQES